MSDSGDDINILDAVSLDMPEEIHYIEFRHYDRRNPFGQRENQPGYHPVDVIEWRRI